MLLPEEGNQSCWAQLYIYDTEHEIENRINVSKSDGENSSIDRTMLDQHNVLSKTFRMARDRFKEDDYHDYTLKLIGKRNKSGTHNLPSASEVAALVVRNPSEESVTRHIIGEFKDMGPQRISNIYPKLMSLQYHLLFSYGEDGFTLQIPYQFQPRKKDTREKMSQCLNTMHIIFFNVHMNQ
jgi:hypothetical protein